jgi:hypothetical protein
VAWYLRSNMNNSICYIVEIEHVMTPSEDMLNVLLLLLCIFILTAGLSYFHKRYRKELFTTIVRRNNGSGGGFFFYSSSNSGYTTTNNASNIGFILFIFVLLILFIFIATLYTPQPDVVVINDGKNDVVVV